MDNPVFSKIRSMQRTKYQATIVILASSGTRCRCSTLTASQVLVIAKRHNSNLAGITVLFVSPIFPLICLPSPAHPAGFSFCNFTGFLAIFNIVTVNYSNNVMYAANLLVSHIKINCWFNLL